MKKFKTLLFILILALNFGACLDNEPDSGSTLNSSPDSSDNDNGGSTLNKVIWYVDGEVENTGNGLSWETAFKTIKEAVKASSDENDDEVWVKAGTYILNETIDIDDYVFSLYGGFAGTETKRSQRDYSANVTTIDGNDNPVLVEENLVHNGVKCFYVTGNRITIDGFYITKGWNSGEGGGAIQSGYFKLGEINTTVSNCIFYNNNSIWHAGAIYNEEGNMNIDNCTFTDNTSVFKGGAVFSYSLHSNNITNCTFSGNYANNGGAVFIDYSKNDESGDSNKANTITNCVFSGNSSNQDGGAIICDPDLTVTGCRFTNNTAVRYGTIATYCDSGKTIAVYNCIFSGNKAERGAGFCINGSSGNIGRALITNCTFTENTASTIGSAVYNCKDIDAGSGSLFSVTNCILWSDTTDKVAAAGSENMPTVTYCDIDQEGYAGSNGNIRQDPLLNSEYHLTTGSPCIDAGDNSAVSDISVDIDNNSRIINSIVDMGADELVQ